MTDFQYIPLDTKAAQFRLLELTGAEEHDAPIYCHLAVHEFDRRPEYKALSYTWGQLPASRTIRLNGHTLAIRPNLEQALRYLRLRSASRLLWIDAICIDQANLDEKSGQLALMRDIYAEAKQVLIWLGGPDVEVEFVFGYLLSLTSSDDESVSDHNFEWPQPDDPDFLTAMPGFLKLFQNPWWKRVWTAQELVVAKGKPLLVCGHSELDWDILNKMIICLTVYVPNVSKLPLDLAMEPIESVCLLRRAWQNANLRNTNDVKDTLRFDNLLIATSDRLASNPKDQIFAVLGMLLPGQQTSIVQNYNESVSSIYQTAMVEAIKSRGSLEFLRYAVIPKGSNGYMLPSWCLDFSVPNWNNYREGYHTFLLHSKIWEKMRQTFTGIDFGQSFEIQHKQRGEFIRVLGVKIGTVVFAHSASTKRLMQHSDTASGRTIEARFKDVKDDVISQRGFDCFYSILDDYRSFSLVIPEALEGRVGKGKASDLFRKGVVWRVFDGNKRKEEEEEKTLQKLWKMGLDNKQLGYYELVMLWADCFFASIADDRSNDESERERPDEQEQEEEEGLDNKNIYKSKKSNPEQDDLVPSDWPYSEAIYKHLFFEVSSIGSYAAGKAFFATNTGLVGRSEHSIQGQYDGTGPTEEGSVNDPLKYYMLSMLCAKYGLPMKNFSLKAGGGNGDGIEREEEQLQNHEHRRGDGEDHHAALECWNFIDHATERLASRTYGETLLSCDNMFAERWDQPEPDIICILQKCTRPVVLRPCKDGRFKIVSFAYVHDIFEDSETAIDLSKHEAEWFELC